MPASISSFAIAVPDEGPCGLAIPHLNQGELLGAAWLPGVGLVLRGRDGSSVVEVDAELMAEHFGGYGEIQILETEPGKEDRGWVVPLAGAPAAIKSASK